MIGPENIQVYVVFVTNIRAAHVGHATRLVRPPSCHMQGLACA